MSRVNELEQKLEEANARIRQLEKLHAERPITIRRMKAEISEAIGQTLNSGNYTYGATVSRDDLLKIHAWIMERTALTKSPVVTVTMWDPSANNGKGKEFETTVELETLIRNPSRVRMDVLGLHLLNSERKKRNLPEYRRNLATGTFDEVST